MCAFTLSHSPHLAHTDTHNSLLCYVLGSGLFLRFYARASKRIFTHTGRWTWTAGKEGRETDNSDDADDDDDDDDGNNSEIPVPVQSFMELLHIATTPSGRQSGETGLKMRRRWRWRCAAARMYLDKQTGQRATKTSAKQQMIA